MTHTELSFIDVQPQTLVLKSGETKRLEIAFSPNIKLQYEIDAEEAARREQEEAEAEEARIALLAAEQEAELAAKGKKGKGKQNVLIIEDKPKEELTRPKSVSGKKKKRSKAEEAELLRKEEEEAAAELARIENEAALKQESLRKRLEYEAYHHPSAKMERECSFPANETVPERWVEYSDRIGVDEVSQFIELIFVIL